MKGNPFLEVQWRPVREMNDFNKVHPHVVSRMIWYAEPWPKFLPHLGVHVVFRIVMLQKPAPQVNSQNLPGLSSINL